MEYKCKTVSLNHILSTAMGIVEPLCNSCKSTECSNPIFYKEVSIFGIMRIYRLYARGQELYAVVECEEGFTTEEIIDDDVEDEKD
jgi:hypothetical protein